MYETLEKEISNKKFTFIVNCFYDADNYLKPSNELNKKYEIIYTDFDYNGSYCYLYKKK